MHAHPRMEYMTSRDEPLFYHRPLSFKCMTTTSDYGQTWQPELFLSMSFMILSESSLKPSYIRRNILNGQLMTRIFQQSTGNCFNIYLLQCNLVSANGSQN